MRALLLVALPPEIIPCGGCAHDVFHIWPGVRAARAIAGNGAGAA